MSWTHRPRWTPKFSKFSTPRWVGVITLLLALQGCVTLSGRKAPAPPPSPTTVVATVNGEPISQADVSRRVEELIRQAREAGQLLTDAQVKRAQPRLIQAAREQLIDKKLVEQAIRNDVIKITDAQVDARIQAMDKELGSEGLSVEGLRNSMQVTPERFREMVRTQLAVDAFWDRRLALKPPTEADLRKTYDKNKSQFVLPVAVHLFEVFVPYPAGRRPTSAERANLRVKAEALHGRLLAGESFASVARDGAAPAPAGGNAPVRQEGDLGWVVERAPLPQPVLKAAFTQAVGKIGEIIETSDGYHILLVSERREPQQVPFEQVKDRMAAQLQRQAREARVPDEIAKLRKQAKIVEP